jgi:hypothetical protein
MNRALMQWSERAAQPCHGVLPRFPDSGYVLGSSALISSEWHLFVSVLGYIYGLVLCPSLNMRIYNALSKILHVLLMNSNASDALSVTGQLYLGFLPDVERSTVVLDTCPF